MAVVFSNNATTVLSSNITNSATSIAVQDGSVFPTLSGTDYFYATLQDPGNTKREIVKVTARSGNTLTVTRAVDGSSASAFSANDAFELRLNAAALNDAVNSGTADLELNSFTGDGSEVDFTLSMEALEANTLVYIDGVYQNKTAYSISGYVLTFSAAPDNGAAIEVTTATVAPIQESTDFLLNQFTGDGSDTTFTLSSSPEENQTTVFISGVYQSKSNYSISGTTLTFSTAPPASSSIEVMVARTVVYGIGTPSNDTVSTAKIVDGAVTPAKLSLTYATETYVGTAVSNLVDSSPAALDTLNELAAALGDDPNFATTVTNSIALKAPLASPSFTGNVTMATGGTIVAGGANDLILNAGESGTPDIYLQSGSSTKVKIEGSNGNVGIAGQTNPTYKLDGGFADQTWGWYLNSSYNAGFTYNTTERSLLISTKSAENIDHIKFATGGAATERVRIDGAGNVALMTDGAELKLYYTEARKFISNSGPSVTIKQIDNHSTGAYIDFAAWDNSSLMRLMNSGSLLVGKTATSQTTAGTVLYSNGQVYSTTSGTQASVLTRLSSDGPIQIFYKDSSEVGRIFSGHGGTQVGIGTNTTGITFNPSTRSMMPANPSSTNPQLDATLDIGFPSVRWKDLYLSGGVYLGGTGAANKLDDYETGTWTLSITTSGGAESLTIANPTGTYTKIGQQVTATIYTAAINITAVGSGVVYLGGLPFAASGGNSAYSVPSFGHTTCFGSQPDGYIAIHNNYVVVTRVGTVSPNYLVSGNPRYLMFTITYFTNA